MSTVYLSTPIYYVNGLPHIGHIYTTVVADAIARYRRLAGDDVFFLTGTDEHAAKVADAAAQQGLTPLAWADHNAGIFRTTFARYGISNDDFVRTSESRHKESVQRWVAQLLETDELWVRVFVPETELGRVKIGQKVDVHIDTFPARAFPARVTSVSERAEYTPRNVQTAAQREDQVFAVRLHIDPAAELKAGMTAIVRFE